MSATTQAVDSETAKIDETRLCYSIGRELREANAILWMLWMTEDLPHQIPDGVLQSAAHAVLGKVEDMEVNLAELGIIEMQS